MRVPLVDLRAQHLSIKEEIDQALARVHEKGNYVMGEQVEAFEEEWARFCRAWYAIGVSSGTDALYLTLKALPELTRDVLTSPFTFFATVQAIIWAGKKPKFMDVEEDGNINLHKPVLQGHDIALPVHLYGRPAYVPASYPTPVIEDSAQAHGLPLSGLAACYSFYPTKNLGAMGQAGAVVTNDAFIAEKIREMRTYGERERFVHYALTGNHRLDELQASILRCKLPHLHAWTIRRRQLAHLYTKHLQEEMGIVVPSDHPQHVYHIYSIRVTDPRGRQELAHFLEAKGIQTAVRYPLPLHLQPALQYLGYKRGDFPMGEKWAQETLSLPLYPELTEDMLGYVAEKVTEWARSGR